MFLLLMEDVTKMKNKPQIEDLPLIEKIDLLNFEHIFSSIL